MNVELRELRFGNALSIGNDLGIVTDIIRDGVVKIQKSADTWVSAPVERFEPIPLTEEWLVKFGFSDREYKPGYIGVDFKANLIIDFVLTKPKMMGEWQEYYVWEHVKNMYTKLEYVHELQNLFHAVTGQELIFKADHP